MASMGCSEIVYNTCKDVYDFITIELHKVPSQVTAHEMRRLVYLYSGDEVPTLFPSFWQTYLQNFILEGRTESQRQRTWPTDPTYTGGFYFL